MRTHTGEKPFQCNICNNKFTQKSYLKVHTVIHSGEKPFQCAICGYKCSCKRYLQGHKLVHSLEKSFRCTICNSSFFQKNSLEVHNLIHTGEKPVIFVIPRLLEGLIYKFICESTRKRDRCFAKCAT